MASGGGVAAQLEAMARDLVGVTGQVKYTAPYAVFVHENLETRHAPGTQAKFLEDPAKDMANHGTVTKIIVDTMEGGGSLKDGVTAVCEELKKRSQAIVPVATGFLHDSCEVVVEET